MFANSTISDLTFGDAPILVPSDETPVSISLAGLSSSLISGRQSAVVDNTSTRYDVITVYFRFTLAHQPYSQPDNTIKIYPYRGDNGSPQHFDYGSNGTDCEFTFSPQLSNESWCHIICPIGDNLNAQVIEGSFVFEKPGPYWGLIIIQNTGDIFDLSESNHEVQFIGSYRRLSELSTI